MTQRIGLAQAILHRPDVVLLDEPTSALDPLGRRDVRDLIRSLKEEGMTVFLNSHLLGEVEMVCDRVAVVDHGRVVQSGRLADLVSGRPEVQVVVDVVDATLLDALDRVGDVVEQEGSALVLRLRHAECAADVADAVIAAGRRLHALVPRHRTLEEVFMELVEGRTT
jgi:ABC-2 type transport system ATP-binding protein